MLWIESQSTPVIALIVFSFTYLFTATIFFMAAVLARRKIGQDLKAVAPQTLTPLGVILGLLIAFLASRVWTNVDRALEYVGQEAGALRETVLLADSLPPDVRMRVREALKMHLQFIDSEEWPGMAGGRATLQSIPVHLGEAMNAVLSFEAVKTNQQLAQNRALIAIENALELRQNRVRLSRYEIAPIQWAVVIIPAVMILLTTAMIQIDKILVMAITMFIFSTAIAANLVLLMVYDRPFGPGGFLIPPTLLREIMPTQEQESSLLKYVQPSSHPPMHEPLLPHAPPPH